MKDQELGFSRLLVLSELRDALGDQVGLDAAFEGLDLAADALIQVGDALAQAPPSGVGPSLGAALVSGELALELVQTHRTEDPVGEELLDEGEQRVFAQGEPLAVTVDLLGSGLAVGAAVVAGQVGVLLALAAVHRERLVAGSAADHAREEIGGLAVAPAVGPATALPEALLGAGEHLVGDQRQVLDLGDHPFLLGPQAGGAAGLALGREVQAVPHKAPGVRGVAQHGAKGALGPVAADVALRVDVRGGGRASRAIELVGDRLAPPALVGPQVEDLDDHCRLVGVRDEAGLDLPGPRTSGDGMRRLLEAVAIGRPPAATEALQGVLAHAALRLARQLLALVLIESLLQRDQQPALGGGRVAGSDGIVDLDAVLLELAMEKAGGDAVARQPGGLVDDDAVKAPSGGVSRFLGQRSPAGSVVSRAGLLVEELDLDGAAQLGGLALARLELGRARERLVLLVVGGQAPVEREAQRHQMTATTCGTACSMSSRASDGSLTARMSARWALAASIASRSSQRSTTSSGPRTSVRSSSQPAPLGAGT